jgi:hypothetical protein
VLIPPLEPTSYQHGLALYGVAEEERETDHLRATHKATQAKQAKKRGFT